MDSIELQSIANSTHEFIIDPKSEQLEEYKRGPVTDSVAKQALERAFGKELKQITFEDTDDTDLLLKAMKGVLEFFLSNEVDTSVETGVIEQSEDAKLVEKLMNGINSLNQQVSSVHF